VPQVTVHVRLIFLAAIAFLAVQRLFIHRFGEPYPAIVMPGFNGDGGYQDGQVKIDRYMAVFVADGEEFSFPPKVLLEEFPDSHHGAISYVLMPRIESPQVVATGRLKRLGDAFFPGIAAWRTSRDSPENIGSLKDWLRSRGGGLVPGRSVSRVEFRWFRETVRVDGGWLESEREPIDTLVITLEGEPK
jgi:hypothetical protein